MPDKPDAPRLQESDREQERMFGTRAEMLWQIVDRTIDILEGEAKNIKDPELRAEWGMVVSLHRNALAAHEDVGERTRGL